MSMLAYFRGDMTSALHILVPQLENSLRHVLRMQGHDVTRLTEEMNQEDLTLSGLLENRRNELVAIFGERMVTDIDNLFNARSGPNLRNRIAHGLIGQWAPHSDDAIYACWLIVQLCCIPLRPLGHVKAVKRPNDPRAFRHLFQPDVVWAIFQSVDCNL